ncbi:hypothetical protein ACNRWW_08095 [Metabacillus sp. HB246100]|uniref:hypothetical protein n=1 Tax=Bacillus weihaiensis TaxID=1547283 RepID=UPI00235724A7|nr:hypothetical protein [Bacillus weihaiensis]
MKRTILIAFIIPVVILSSCDTIHFSTPSANERITQEKQLLFFSDDENIDREAVYYDALLDIKREFPEDFKKMEIISGKHHNKEYNVDTFPCLLVVEQQEVLVHIEGSVSSKDDIIEPIKTILTQ